jgi:glutamyl-tRNA reductase
MITKPITEISSFFITGINYKKSDTGTRGQFSVNTDQYEQILQRAKELNIADIFVLSTCNRTEVFGFAQNAGQLAELLCGVTEGSLEDFKKVAYFKTGIDAITHLFNVAAGLDSQILGDYEIVGQIKLAAKFSREQGCMGANLERLVNQVLQASKKIRTTTAMSGGTVSVSFAAIQFARQYYKNVIGKKILLLGTGKIGRNTCKNILDYLPGCPVTVVNRTIGKAAALAEKYELSYGHIEDLQTHIENADIIIVATNADEPIVTENHFRDGNAKLVIDLSMPCNVALGVKQLPYIVLLNVDELSKIKDVTLQKRKAEIPKVKEIIGLHIKSFMAWHEERKYVPVLKQVKTQLQKIQAGHGLADLSVLHPCEKIAEQKIQKAINGMAVKLRTKNSKGCHYIEAMNDFISTASN